LPPPSPDGRVESDLAGGAKSGVPFGILGPVPTAAPPPPHLVEKKAPPRIQVGGIVQSAKLLRQPKPVYRNWPKRPAFRALLSFTP
jgi:protein TonB